MSDNRVSSTGGESGSKAIAITSRMSPYGKMDQKELI